MQWLKIITLLNVCLCVCTPFYFVCYLTKGSMITNKQIDLTEIIDKMFHIHALRKRSCQIKILGHGNPPSCCRVFFFLLALYSLSIILSSLFIFLSTSFSPLGVGDVTICKDKYRIRVLSKPIFPFENAVSSN